MLRNKKLNILSKLNNLTFASDFVNSLDDVADISLLNKIDNLSQLQLDGLNTFYKNRPSPTGFSKTDYNFTATKTINQQSVSINYRYGFPDFHNTNFCPSMSYSNGTRGKFKFQNDNLETINYTDHFGMANEALAAMFGKGSPSWPIKNAEGFFQVGNYRWNGKSPQFELQSVNGQWEKYTWHHYEDGKTIIPVLSDVHSVGAGGFAHSGGNAIFDAHLKGLFDTFSGY